jgi:GAF domain-containing protein
MWLARQEQSLSAQRSPEMREGPQTGVPRLDVGRKPLAQASFDSAGPSFLALPAAKEAAKETIRQEKTEAVHDRGPELTAQPFQLSAGDDARTDASAGGGSTPLFNGVPKLLFREIVQQALQATHATGAAIALMQQGELICRATTGEFASEFGKMINTGSGFTEVCASSGTMQLCSNTALDSRVDADACRKLGVGAIIVVPLLHQDQLRGLIAVFSRRPYAFGMRDLQALQDLAGRFAANL